MPPTTTRTPGPSLSSTTRSSVHKRRLQATCGGRNWHERVQCSSPSSSALPSTESCSIQLGFHPGLEDKLPLPGGIRRCHDEYHFFHTLRSQIVQRPEMQPTSLLQLNPNAQGPHVGAGSQSGSLSCPFKTWREDLWNVLREGSGRLLWERLLFRRRLRQTSAQFYSWRPTRLVRCQSTDQPCEGTGSSR